MTIVKLILDRSLCIDIFDVNRKKFETIKDCKIIVSKKQTLNLLEIFSLPYLGLFS